MSSASTAHRILIIDDDEDDFFITSEYIQNIPKYHFIIEWCFDYAEALQLLYEKKYDLYIVDYYLGARTGLDFIKDAVKECDDPIILLTGKGNQRIDIEAMQAGAVDYLIKGEMDTEKLERSIRHSLERSKTMKALRANEVKYRHIFENSLNAIFLMDEQLAFKDANPATSDLLGYSKDELMKISLFCLMSPEYDKNLLKEKLAMNEDVKEELELITKQGDVRYCLLSFSKEKDENGNAYVQGIAHDISGLKKEERKKIHREKIDMAERITRVLAHEIRNPLNNIDLAADQLGTEPGTDELHIYLEIINRNSKRIAGLITELLRGTPTIDLSANNLKDIIEESIAAAKDRLTLKKIRLVTSYPEHEVVIQADASKLKIAFLNIIINAIEAMMPETGVLAIEAIDKNSDVVVIIRDNGCGIKEENVPHLFEAYYTDKKNGLGLGLSTTYNIITLHNAQVEVTSRLNEGTTFVITFPKD